ncbi:MAG: EAL domain-containing protein [Gammaproteobacteria bacterium]|nr:EAL domain-containing protein [Gammaproteobacteria bacterium]
MIFLSVIPLLILGVSSYHISQRTLQAEAQRHTLQLLRNQRGYLTLQLEQVEALIANISGVEAILEALGTANARVDAYTQLATQAHIGYILNNYLNLKGLVSIDIFTVGGDHYHVGDTLNVSQADASTVESLFQAAISSDRLVLWSGVENNVNLNSTEKQVITAAKVLRRVNRRTLDREPVALLLANYGINDLYDQFHQIDLGKDAYLQVIDQHNRLIYHPNRTLIGASLDPVSWRTHLDQDWSLVAVINDEPHTISHVAMPQNGWYLESIIPNRTLAAGASPIQRVTVLILSVCFGMVALVATLYSRHVVQPVQAVIDSFKRLRDERLDLNTRLLVNSRDEIGELTRWFNLFMENLQAQRTAEQALRESEERYSLAMRGANDGLWDWDLQRQQLYLAPRFKEMLGYTENDLSNDPIEWLSRIHPADRRHMQDALTAHLERQAPYFECEYRLLHKDQHYFWVLSRGLAVRDSNDAPYRMAGSSTDIDRRKHGEEQLRHQALHDTLTGLPNRTAFMDYLHQAIERHKRFPDRIYAVLFLDLDHFKLINDTQGHSAGDALLVAVTQRLRGSIRTTDTLARLGGDEFVLLLEDLDDVRNVLQTADRLLETLALPLLVLQGQQTVNISASIGITLSSLAYETPEQLLRDADIAMYRAKALGKARYELFDVGMRDQILRQLTLETELKQALRIGEFRLWYQPIVAMLSEQIHGFEALLRWQHPERGLLAPGEFMATLENTGLIVPLGVWVLEEACRQLADWRHRYPPAASLKISVNLSARQFQHEHFVQSAVAILARTGLPASALAMEVTETTLIQDTADAAAMLKQLENLGFEIHMDDFGTGYSSLSYLDTFQVDAIKIDRSFVSKITASDEPPGLIKTLIALAKEMQIKTIAEGIETAEQWACLKAQGCHYGQGYYLSRPLAPPAAEALLQALLAFEPHDYQQTATDCSI